MPNIVKLAVEAPEEILNTGAYGGGAVVRLQWSATQAGAFVDVSGTGSTPTTAVVSGTNTYTAYDPNGTSTTWYQSRFENVGATRLSDWTAAFQVAALGTAGQVCSIYDIKQRLGKATTNTADDEEILQYIGQASDWIAEHTGQQFYASPAATVRLYDGFDSSPDGMRLRIREGIQSVSLLEVAQFTAGTFATVPASQYFLRPQTFTLPPGWPQTEIWLTNYPTSANTRPAFYDGFDNIRVTGVFDWPGVPRPIEAIGQRFVMAQWRGRSADSSGMTVSVGIDGERTFFTTLSANDKATLRRYSTDPITVG